MLHAFPITSQHFIGAGLAGSHNSHAHAGGTPWGLAVALGNPHNGWSLVIQGCRGMTYILMRGPHIASTDCRPRMRCVVIPFDQLTGKTCVRHFTGSADAVARWCAVLSLRGMHHAALAAMCSQDEAWDA